LEVLSSHLKEKYFQQQIERLNKEFHANIQSWHVTRPEFDAIVMDGIKRAKQYGIVNQDDSEMFLDCMMMYGPKFDTDPKNSNFSKIFNDTELTGFEKMQKVHDLLVFGNMGA